MRLSAPLALALIALAAPSSAGAVPALDPVERSLSADATTSQRCFTRAAAAADGVATTIYRAPMSGYATVRLAAAGGDWDLALFERHSGRRVASSSSFGARELAQTWIGSGEELLVQGCRRSGDSRDAKVSVELLDVEPPDVGGASPMLLRVPFGSQADLARLAATGVDVTHHIHDGKADVIASGPQQAAALRRAGFEPDVEIADLAGHYAAARRADAAYAASVGTSPLPTGRTNYRVYDDYQSELKQIAEEHPDIVKPLTLPHPSFQGRPVEGIEIGHQVEKPDDGRPVFLLVGLHHAREWPAAETVMEFAHMVVNNEKSDNRIKRLLRQTRVIVVPIINPDGFISSRGAVDPVDLVTNQGAGNGTGQGVNPNLADLDESGGDDVYDCPPVISSAEDCDARLSLFTAIAPPGGLLAYRRKNCDGAVPDGRVPCELQWGVDPNRNYGYNWGGPGSSGEPMSQSYRGTGPWSEPETKNVHELSQGRQVTNIVTVHNVAALVLRPPGVGDGGFAPDEDALKAVGDAMGAATGYESQYSFQLYDTSGTTEDWNYAQQGAFGFTIEIGPEGGEFHMPYETAVVDEWTGETAGNGLGLREAYMIAWEAAENPAYHSIIEGTAVPETELRLTKSFDTVTKPTCRTDVGISPLNSEVVYDLLTEFAGTRPCADPLGPQTVPDGLDTTMVVPDDGAFNWHVNPSTRPFVGKPKEGQRAVLRERQVDGSNELLQPPPTAGESEISDTEEDIVIAAGEEPSQLRVELNWETAGEDYDMYLFRDDGGELVPVGNGRGPGVGESASATRPEFIEVDDPAAGRYVLRITNWAAATNDWTLRIQELGAPTTLPGEREQWTLSCEGPGGTVGSRPVEVDRGGRVSLDLTGGCGI